MQEKLQSNNKTQKILLLYIVIIFLFLVFLGFMLRNALYDRHLPSKYAATHDKAQRGSIISYDGFHIATTQKLYKAVVNTKNIDPDKYELFVKLFQIYSGMDEKTIRKRLKKKRGVVVLSYTISPKNAQYLKTLAYELLRYKVFKEYETPSGRTIFQGLSILESGERRVYEYKDLLTPVIGYPRKMEDNGYTRVYGVRGIEKFYDNELSSYQNGSLRGLRDVNSYIILNKEAKHIQKVNGMDVKLSIPVALQIRIEKVLSKYKKVLQAEEVMSVVMDSHTGRIYAFASSNRYDPAHIHRSDYPSLRPGAIEYAFEPGSVIKPITFSLLLEEGLVNPYDLVNGHNGHFKIGRKRITDEHKFQWLSAENVIVYSSNVGMAQLAQKLNGLDFHEGFKKFGFTQKTGLDLPFERRGSIPSIRKLNDEIYKATASYGYGIRVTLMQLARAYSTFNNGGSMVSPYLLDSLVSESGKKIVPHHAPSQAVIPPAIAKRMKSILIKTVQKGTGKKTIVEGLEVGGKTGTAHLVEHGKYVNQYNTSFMGFVNDAKHHYTIGTVVIRPQTNHFASSTAVPVNKAIIETLIDEGYLTPSK